MPIVLKTEQDIPLPTVDTGLPASLTGTISYEAQARRVNSAVNALNKLIEMGATISEDGEVEGEIDLADGAESKRPIEAFTGRAPLTPTEYSKPAVLMKLHLLLKDYDKSIVSSTQQLRTYVTNKLLKESDEAEKSSDRIRALELIGKMGDVALFTDKTETTIKHGTTEELEAVLRKRLQRLIEIDKDEYTTVIEVK